MRADMFKIIVERPRWGSGHAPAVKLKRSRNDFVFIGHKRHVAAEARYSKCLNENLAPLLRFLRSRRGRAWDDVFGEVCERLDTGSTVKMHVRQHLGDLVMLDIVRGRFGEWIHEGRVLNAKSLCGRWRPLFVDPEDGLLKDKDVLLRRLAILEGQKGGRQ